MKVLKNISIAVVSLIALFVVIGLFLPRTWEVSRSKTMAASKDRIYSEVANLHNFTKWSPWTDEQDKSLQYTYSGPDIGVGAQQDWTSDKMGKGWLKVVKADPESGIVYELFIDMGSMQSTLTGTMDFESTGDQTTVTWTDAGDSGNNIFKRWMTALFIKRALGPDLEKGLDNLKALVEKEELVEQLNAPSGEVAQAQIDAPTEEAVQAEIKEEIVQQ